MKREWTWFRKPWYCFHQSRAQWLLQVIPRSPWNPQLTTPPEPLLFLKVMRTVWALWELICLLLVFLWSQCRARISVCATDFPYEEGNWGWYLEDLGAVLNFPRGLCWLNEVIFPLLFLSWVMCSFSGPPLLSLKFGAAFRWEDLGPNCRGSCPSYKLS